MLLFYFVSAAVGYLLGSFPTGYLVGCAYGIDIREHGSGNVGATNVLRVLGKKPGYLVFVCDALKGWLAVFLSTWLIGDFALGGGLRSPAYVSFVTTFRFITDLAVVAGIPAGIGCILGHNFSVWLRFRGGKGVATTVGVLLGLMPVALGISAVIWFTGFYLFRYVSLASLLGALALPVTVWVVVSQRDIAHSAATNPVFWFSVAAGGLIFWRHRTNIHRLLNGTEPRFDRKPAPVSPPADS